MEHFLLYWDCYLWIFIGIAFWYFLARYTRHDLLALIIFGAFFVIGMTAFNTKEEKIKHEAKIMTFCTEVMQIEVDDTSKLEKCVKLTRDLVLM